MSSLFILHAIRPRALRTVITAKVYGDIMKASWNLTDMPTAVRLKYGLPKRMVSSDEEPALWVEGISNHVCVVIEDESKCVPFL